MIAITQRLVENDPYPETRDALDLRWAKFFKAIDVLPIILPTEYDFTNYFREISISGIVLTGGNDLSTVSQSPLSRKRDSFEKALLGFAVEHGMPVLGICRGMQLIAEYFGGTIQRVEGHSGTRHNLIPQKKGRLFNTKNIPKEVNSYHRYAVTELPDCLHTVATDEEGVIEALEHTILPVAAHMWHPEREAPFNPSDLDLAQRLFKSRK